MTIRVGFMQKILIAACVVVAVSFSAFGAAVYYRQQSSIASDLSKYMSDIGGLAARNVQSWIAGRILLVESLAELAAARSDETSSLLGQKVLSSNFSYIYYGSNAGNFTQVPNEEMPAGYDPRQRPWYSQAAHDGFTVLTPPYVDANSKELTMTIATPVYQAGELMGVMGGDLEVQYIAKIINSLNLNGMGYAFLVDGQGKILVHPDEGEVLKNVHDIFPGVDSLSDGAVREIRLGENSRILSFSKIEGLQSADWYVGLSVDKKAAYSTLASFKNAVLIGALITIVLVAIILSLVIKVLVRPLRSMALAMQDISEGEGDLTRRLEFSGDDEIATLGRSFNIFVGRIHDSICKVRESAKLLNISSLDVVSHSDSSLSNSRVQSHRTSSVVAAIHQLGAAAQEIAGNAANASKEASGVAQEATQGREVVDQTINSMGLLTEQIRLACETIEALNGKSRNIGGILEVIKSISQQTNLLALNAAIEAARAGDAGRGFAVVADEVRSLAYRTQGSAQEIQGMIEELQVGTVEAVRIMTESRELSMKSMDIAHVAGEGLLNVSSKIELMDAINQSVAAATEEQTAVISSINLDIVEMSQLNEDAAEKLQLTLAACNGLDSQVAALQSLVRAFKI